MRLYIAEKPSLARAIVEALPGPARKAQGYYQLDNGDMVSWCVGHLLALAEPEVYNAEFKKWNYEHLPIVPEKWQQVPRKSSASQLAVLRKLVAQADFLVHAGDPDREGQLLVDEVFAYLKVPAAKKQRIQRCLISDLNLDAVRRALSQMRSNQEFQPLSVSALARSRADWLYGINLTRALTLQGQQAGYRGVLSVGRVQTPILGLVVRRDSAIDEFVSQTYYELWANLTTEQNEPFKAQWIPGEASEPWLDEQRRNLSRALAEHVARRVQDQPGQVTSAVHKKNRQAAPLPHSLSSLQMDANRAFGLSAQQVLDVCQKLYETHKAITYPRSDCRHLPQSHWAEAPGLMTNIRHNAQQLGIDALDPAWDQLDATRKSKAWNDKQVTAHHAIIPTGRRISRLDDRERQVYQLICRNYLAQFLPQLEQAESKVELQIDKGMFRAKQIHILKPGWKCLFPQKSDANKEEQPPLPKLVVGQTVRCHDADILEKQTTPPKPFTEATLLAALTGIGRYVQDQSLKNILKETDGLGTEATRAGILELLIARGFLHRQGKSLRATETGKAIIKALPECMTLPDMTARWESTLAAIAEGLAGYQDLMQPLTKELDELCQALQQRIPQGLRGLKPPRGRKAVRKPRPNKRRKKSAARQIGDRL